MDVLYVAVNLGHSSRYVLLGCRTGVNKQTGKERHSLSRRDCQLSASPSGHPGSRCAQRQKVVRKVMVYAGR